MTCISYIIFFMNIEEKVMYYVFLHNQNVIMARLSYIGGVLNQ